MKERLQKKLHETHPYSRQELDWLLDHIGDEDASIRDDLVYASFCHVLLSPLLAPTDFDYLVETILQRELLFYQIDQVGSATLTRSFTALVLALILHVDTRTDSFYYQRLLEGQRQILFDWSLFYLTKENDSQGWHKNNGWIHAIAHGAELLLSASLHDAFPKERLEEVWKNLLTCLQSQKQVFSAGEERRLALVIAQLLSHQKLDPDWLAEQIRQMDWEKQSPQDYFAWLNLENTLSSLYLLLSKEGQLPSSLATAIEEIWEGT